MCYYLAMALIYLALGSNVGDSRAHIEKAVGLLGGSVSNITCAPIYRSKAVGYTDQADFFNTAVCGETNVTPTELLRFVKDVESRVGRIQRFRWGPREVDIDIIFYDQQIVNGPMLTIPHALFRERDFVLRPICDLAPELVDPVSGLSVKQLLDRLQENDLSILERLDN